MNYTIDYYFDLQSIDNENVVDILKNIIDSNNISDESLDYHFEILDNETQQIIFKGGEPTNTIPYRYFEEVADYLTHRKREVEEKRNSFLDSLFKPTKPIEEVVENDTTEISEPTNHEQLLEPYPIVDTQPVPEPSIMDAQVQPLPEPSIMDAQVQPLPESSIMDTQPLPEPSIMDAQPLPEPSIMDAQVQPLPEPSIMDTQAQPLPEPSIMDTQAQQQPPMMDAQAQQQPPVMDAQSQQQPPSTMNTQLYQGGNVKSSIITVRIIIQKMKSLPFLFLKKMRYNSQK
uniref:Uncharacterized protein n=1 Tax=viral metagenome TaxID=1070528 RepID=A0A6C0LQD7_9ZZZZ